MRNRDVKHSHNFMNKRKKIAFIHRYGLEGWICCGGHAIPGVVKKLFSDAEIHFYGPHTTEAKDPELRSMIRMHELPYTWNRANPTDKVTKTLIWYFWLPLIGLRCRMDGTKLIWNDETVPFTALLLRLFFGRNVAITVMDFFARIYTENHPRLDWLSNLVERIDFTAWRKLPLIFTKVLYTREFLEKQGVPQEVMHLYRNPIDHAKFHPVDDKTRKATRKKLGFNEDDIVLSHHGILHPNKGNDWILERIAETKNNLPNLKFLLIGNGPEAENLKQLAAALEIKDRAVFTGWLPTEEDLNNALAAADIGLVMRIGQETDHFHMTDTLAHEMACGKPILAVNLRGIAEVIDDGENGFLFSPEQPSEFHERLKRLAENAELRRSYGGKALELSRQLCGVDACSSDLAEAIRKQIKEPPHA